MTAAGTSERIVSAALALFAVHGWSGVTAAELRLLASAAQVVSQQLVAF